MKLFDNIKENTIIVTEYKYKLNLLKELNKSKDLLDITFLTKDEFIKKFYFDYDERSIYFLMEKYEINEDIARIYLENIYYVENKEYKSKKLNQLFLIKQELIDNNLLIFDTLFKDYLKNKNVIFYNYNYFNKFELNMISEIKEITSCNTFMKEYKDNFKDKEVYEFSTLLEEVEFVATKIVNLIEKGIEINDIKLANVDDDYKSAIDLIFPMYNLKTDINDSYIISTKIAKEFLNYKGTINEKIDFLNSKYKNSDVLNKIVNTVNKYIKFDNDTIVNEMIVNEFKKLKVKRKIYSNEIEVIDYKNYPIDNQYVFLLGFNQNKIPVIYKDEDYITDDIKDGLLLDTTLEKNKKEKDAAINNILNIKNLIITYKKQSFFEVFYPSNLIKELSFSVIKDCKFDKIYSGKYAKVKLSRMLDDYVFYGSKSMELKKLYSTIPDIPYNKYNNSYKQIDKSKFRDFIKDGFNLSYSSMNDYYKCAFKYYLSNVLKLNIYEDNFMTYIGSLFHYVLENGLKDESLKTSDLVSKFIEENERVLDKKESFYVSKLIKDIDFALSEIKNNLNNTNLKNMLFEERVEVIKNRNVTVTFKGFIDKIMYNKDKENTIVCIVDYKTGYADIDLKYVPFGLSMQLPIYLYLAKNLEKLQNIEIGGFYLQQVLNSEPVINSKKDTLSLRKENLLLHGYSNSDENILKELDKTYKDSKVIKSMKLTNNGTFYSYSKVLNNEEIDNLIDITNKKIDDAIDSISDAKFDINPKVTDRENLGCKWCKYHDICYVEEKDKILIKPDNTLSFLGGDLNA